MNRGAETGHEICLSERTETEDGRCEKDVKRIIGLACAAFGGLARENVERKEHLHRNQNETLLRPGSASLAVRLRMLESEERGRAKAVSGRDELRIIIGRSRREKVRNEQTRDELGAQETVVQKIKKRRLQWFGHVERIKGKRLPNAALHGHAEGKRGRGRQMKTWMDDAREDLTEKTST